MLNLFIKSFIITFVGNALTLFDSLFISILFNITSLFKFFSLLSNVLFTKLAISFTLTKFTCTALLIAKVNHS